MTAAVVCLAVVLALAIGGVIALAVMLRSSLASERASMAVEGIASRQQLTAERDRDAAIGRAAQAEVERDNAQAALVSFQSLFKSASAEEVLRVHDQIQSGTATDAVDILNGILSKPLANRPAAVADGTGHDPGDSEPAALPTP